jgi:hypothetical protein
MRLDINYELERNIKLIIDNEIPDEDFNQFAVDFYFLTKNIMVSLNKFLNLRGIKNPKILQIKNAGELIYISRDSIKVRELLKAHGYDEIPKITPQIAYYIIKKNKYSMEQNWENIIQVLKEGHLPSRFMANKKIILNEEQKGMVKKEVKEMLMLKDHEINWILENIKKLKKEDKELFEKFKAIL